MEQIIKKYETRITFLMNDVKKAEIASEVSVKELERISSEFTKQ